MRSTSWMILVALTMAVGGCAPWSTYPAIDGATDIGDPLFPPMPGLMSEAVWYAYEQYGDGGQIALNLPENTSPAVYDRVFKRIEAHPAAPGEPAYNVTAVRVRASEAEVDIIHPNGLHGGPELVTIAFKHVMPDGYRIQRARRWQYAVAAPEANYISWDDWRARDTAPAAQAEASSEYTD